MADSNKNYNNTNKSTAALSYSPSSSCAGSDAVAANEEHVPTQVRNNTTTKTSTDTTDATPSIPPLPQQTDPTHHHQRTISWGAAEEVQFGHIPIPEKAPRQRSDVSSLKGSHTSNIPDIEISFLPTATTTATANRILFQSERPNKHGDYELPGEGIVNPLEAEAETYLVRAMERIEGSTTNNITAPATEDQAFLDHLMDLASVQSSTLQSVENVDGSQAAEDQASTKPPPASPTPSKTTNHHRRTATLDERLYGLAHAISTIHTTEELLEPGTIVDDPRRLRADTLETLNQQDMDNSVPNSSFDTLAQNADAWYQQQQEEGTTNQLLTRQDYGIRRRPRLGSTATASDLPPPIPEELFTTVDDVSNDIEAPQLNNDNGKDDGNDNTNQPSSEKPLTPWIRAKAIIFDEWAIANDIRNFMAPKQNLVRFLQMIVFFIGLPALAAASILFYFVDNPPTGRLQNQGNAIDGKILAENGEVLDSTTASWSYVVLFFGVRQMVTLLLAVASQLFWVDFLAIDRGYLFRLGSRLPLFVMQARGWPFVLFFWSVYGWALLAGGQPFFSHWLYFQNTIDLFNGTNPSGDLITSNWNHRLLGLATGVSFVVAAKRFWMAIFLGTQTYHRYSEKLATLMQKILLISEVAALSRQIGTAQGKAQLKLRGETLVETLTKEKMGDLLDNADKDHSEMDSKENGESSVSSTIDANTKGVHVVDTNDRNPLTGNLSNAQRNRIVRLLGRWEEPTEHKTHSDDISIASLMHFRRAMSCLSNDLPFSASFGPANTRESCIQSCQEVFERLMKMSMKTDVLNFEVLALLGAKATGTLDQAKLLEMIKLFRPDRDGSLAMLHFVRSVDKVYKEMRMLNASVRNSSKIDGQFETIFNVGFYGVILVVSLNVLGFDPLAIFVSISGLVLGFAFMIGTASSKYFEGLLFILVRRPYSIGDCIHVSDPNQDTSHSASAFWFVEDITLFSTHVRFYFTNERASLSNGSLANSRIINSSKSYNASVFHLLKFPLDVSYEKVKLFHEALEAFVRNRPREWIGMSAFRATTVNADLGYIEYVVGIDHRESWAYWAQVKTSHSDLMRFGVELATKLNIIYRQPTLPIEVAVNGPAGSSFSNVQSDSPRESHTLSPRRFQRPQKDHTADIQDLAAKFPPRVPRKMT